MKKIIILLLFVTLTQCGLTSKITEKELNRIINEAVVALYEEPDLTIAKSAIESDVKLLEGLTRSYPGNSHFKSLLSQAYCAYSLGFVEDESPERAVKIYQRGRKAAEKALRLDLDKITEKELKKELRDMKYSQLDVVFWAAFNWSLELFLRLDDPVAIMRFGKIKLLMEWVSQRNSEYYHGAPYIFWGAMYSILPPIAGGNLEKSKENFQLAFKTSDNHFLLAKYYYLSQYCLTLLDEEEFDKVYQEIRDFDLSLFPEQKLANQIAKKKARKVFEQKNEFF